MALKTAIYMRVSTQDQNVDSQRQELLTFIERRDDLELIGEYADVISGTREKREHLDRLMIDARQRKIDVVLFFDLSRLTRKGLSHAIGLLDEWQQAGVKPICYAYPMLDFTDDAGIGKVMAAMLAWMAEQERKMIQRRIRAGLAARKAKGGRLGRVPLAMKTVNHARRLRESSLSYAEIGKVLKISKGSAFNACRAEAA
jgi:DNA invertase Pin-like site-specific DNA recombinase